MILPPKAVDTPEELAQLSQFVINIIDFRDPDCAMTHFVNPDVVIAGVLAPNLEIPIVTTGVTPVPKSAVTLEFTGYTPPTVTGNPPTQNIALDQYGMEYNPVALNEVLAYSFQYLTNPAKTTSRANRFFAELVNTLTSPEISAQSGLLGTFNPSINLGGYGNTPTSTDPYAGGSWDIVFTADDPYSRPDPYRGQLVPYANTYGLTPLYGGSFTPPTANPAAPVALLPLHQGGTIPNPAAAPVANGIPGLPTDYFYAFGNAGPNPAGGATIYEANGPAVGVNVPLNTVNTAGTTTYAVPRNTPSLIQAFTTTVDPFNGPNATTPPTTSNIPLYLGTLPAPPCHSRRRRRSRIRAR